MRGEGISERIADSGSLGATTVPAQALNQDGNDVAGRNRADDATHRLLQKMNGVIVKPPPAEWEYAASSGNPDFRWGELWEWTGSAFEPYPGFSADAYLEYSAPWFGTHQVLRGASFVTQQRIRSPRYRNFFMPERDDIFAGFRTCVI